MTSRLAVTPGEPAGIGPDIVVQIAQTSQQHELVVFADPDLLLERAKMLQLPLTLLPFDFSRPPAASPPGTLKVSPIQLQKNSVAGKPDPLNATYVLDCLRFATDACLHSRCNALVTGPVHKGIIHQAGFRFSGHTEFLAEITHSKQVVMMLASEGLRVALATTHIPLSQVSLHINQTMLENILRVLHRDLCSYFCNSEPVIYVCGLNPHAGDNGALGMEEIDIIIPAIEKLRSENLIIHGPFSADTVFSDENMKKADVFLAMYHDQGLPVLKYKSFGNAVNITLGLNIIRSSVDHGTAFDIAGTGKADCHSLQLAINTAATMHALKVSNVRISHE